MFMLVVNSTKPRNIDRKQAEHTLEVYRQLYDIEKHCRDMSNEQRKAYRNKHSRPILEEFKD